MQSKIKVMRISFTLKRSDYIDSLIAGKFAGMAASRAEVFEIQDTSYNHDTVFTVFSLRDNEKKSNKSTNQSS